MTVVRKVKYVSSNDPGSHDRVFEYHPQVDDLNLLPSSRSMFLHGERHGQFTASRSHIDVGELHVENCVFLGDYEGNGVTNHTRDVPFRRYDGKQMLFSLDGYFTRDMIFCGNSIPRSFGQASTSADEFFVEINEDGLTKIDDEYIFLGTYHRHFGHALVESLGRLWFLQQFSCQQKEKLKFVFFGGWGDSGGPLEYFLSLLDVPLENVMVLRSDAIFRRLIVPSQSWFPWNDWSISTSQSFYGLLNNLRQASNTRSRLRNEAYPKKLYLSREGLASSGMGFNRRELNPETAGKLYGLLNDLGYEKVYMERHMLPEQIAMISCATHICGPAGSAQHLAAFAQNATSQLIISHNEFWMGSTDVVFVWDKDVKLQYFFGSKILGQGPSESNHLWDVDLQQFSKALLSC